MLKSIAETLIPPKYHTTVRLAYSRLESLLYRGDALECPCCGGHFSKFLPRPNRPNVVCPRCRALERHRLLWLYLTRETGFCTDHLKVLHFAPEVFSIGTIRPLKNLDYLSADLFSARADVKVDITNMQFADNTFDVILCSHVLEHIDDDNKAIQEIYRVLKPNGWAIIQIPVDVQRAQTLEDPTIVSREDRMRFYGHPEHVRYYGLDVIDRFRNAGFQVDEIYYARRFSAEQIKRYGLDEDEALYHCRKEVVLNG